MSYCFLLSSFLLQVQSFNLLLAVCVRFLLLYPERSRREGGLPAGGGGFYTKNLNTEILTLLFLFEKVKRFESKIISR